MGNLDLDFKSADLLSKAKSQIFLDSFLPLTRDRDERLFLIYPLDVTACSNHR